MAATVPDDNRRSASIASLLLPSAAASTELPERNLLSLSRLAAEMEPVSPTDAAAAAAFARTRSMPVRRDSRDSRDRLGVSQGSKRLSRTKSAFGNMRRAVAAAAAAASTVATTSSSANSELPMSPAAHGVLRPIHANPPAAAAASSKATTSTTNSMDSCVAGSRRAAAQPKPEAATLIALPRMHAMSMRLDHAPRDIFQVAAARLNADFGEQPRTPVTPRAGPSMMDVDAGARERSSSSHDARSAAMTAAARAPHKARTTPDAKRAQNRESAKRFRVAQKKRWADLQDLVALKDAEIARLTDMLQKVTDARLPVKSRAPSATAAAAAAAAAPLDALVLAELDLFVKLVSSPGPMRGAGTAHTGARPASDALAAPASNIGSLHRVLVATLDGSITGVRHANTRAGVAAGGAVGQYLWDDVHESDSLQLRFTVLHAARMASDMAREALVFAYRRRAARCSADGNSSAVFRVSTDSQGDAYLRIKGCVHPVMSTSGELTHLMLAEFVET